MEVCDDCASVGRFAFCCNFNSGHGISGVWVVAVFNDFNLHFKIMRVWRIYILEPKWNKKNEVFHAETGEKISDWKNDITTSVKNKTFMKSVFDAKNIRMAFFNHCIKENVKINLSTWNLKKEW